MQTNSKPLTKLKHIKHDLLTASDLAKVLGYSANTIYRWMAEGNVPYVVLGGVRKVPRSVLIQWINERSVGCSFYDPGYQVEMDQIKGKKPKC